MESRGQRCGSERRALFAGDHPAPADTRNDGSAFDLPIAVEILVATGQVTGAAAADRVFVGELGLDGTPRAERCALTLARL